MKNSIILFIIISFTWITNLIYIPYLRKASIKLNLLDKPNKRKIHLLPTPTSGGIGILISMLPVLVYLCLENKEIIGIIIGAILLCVIGFIDDKKGLNPLQKLLGQCIAAAIALHFGTTIDWISNPFGGLIYLHTAAYPISMLWIIGTINAFNLIDGIDGLATGIATISSAALCFIAFKMDDLQTAIIAAALLGSCISFLKYNMYPAKIFLGNSGAMCIGFILSCISISGVLKSSLSLSFICPILILAFPLSDTLYAIIRRLKNNEPIFQADKKHMHHQLLNMGFSSNEIMIGICSISAILSSLAIIITLPKNMLIYSSIIFVITCTLLIKKGSKRIRLTINAKLNQHPIINQTNTPTKTSK